MDIVCYMGGTCGDLVTSVIDSTNSRLDRSRIYTTIDRSKLKNSLFKSETEQLNYIKEMELRYLSIPSHKIDLHVKHKHPFITIVTENNDLALWCATRFEKYLPPPLQRKLYSTDETPTVQQYASDIIMSSTYLSMHTNKIIMLEDILSGNLLSNLSKYVKTPLNEKLYEEWLSNQN